MRQSHATNTKTSVTTSQMKASYQVVKNSRIRRLLPRVKMLDKLMKSWNSRFWFKRIGGHTKRHQKASQNPSPNINLRDLTSNMAALLVKLHPRTYSRLLQLRQFRRGSLFYPPKQIRKCQIPKLSSWGLRHRMRPNKSTFYLWGKSIKSGSPRNTCSSWEESTKYTMTLSLTWIIMPFLNPRKRK